MGYDLVEIIDNRLNQLLPEKEKYSLTQFSVDELRDDIIAHLIKDAYAATEKHQSLRKNRGNDKDDVRMRDSREYSYIQHFRNIQYERIKEETGLEIHELLPDDTSSMKGKIDGHQLSKMQYFDLETLAYHPLFKNIVNKRICNVHKMSNGSFIENMNDYDNLISTLIGKLDGDDEEVIFATIALFTLEWKYNVELFYSCAVEMEKYNVTEVPVERLGLLCSELKVPWQSNPGIHITMESRYILHRKQLIPCIFDRGDEWDEIHEKMLAYFSSEYSIYQEMISSWSMTEFISTHTDRAQWADFFRRHYDLRQLYIKKEWNNNRIRCMRHLYDQMHLTQPLPKYVK